MASSSQPPTSPTSFPTSPQTYLLSIHLLKSILHTIHSTSLIPRQPTAPLRSSAASTVSFLSHPIVKIEELFKKRKCVRKRLKRWVTCRDRDYEAFVELKGEVSRVYEELVSGAGPTPPLQDPTPGSSTGSSKSRSNQGLWMKPGHSRPVKPHKDTEETKSLDEQIEKTVPVITLTTPTPRSSKSGSGSSSTVKASQVNPPKKVVDKIINEQITGPSNTHAKTEEHELNSTSKPKAPKESTKSDSSSDSGLWMKGSKRTKGGQVKKAPDEKMI